SPQDCTIIPDEGVFFRSWACTIAVPRKNANGDPSIRPNRIGKRCFTLTSFDFSMSESGSRPEGDPIFEWLERGHFARKERHWAWRAARVLVVMGAAFIFCFSLARSY